MKALKFHPQELKLRLEECPEPKLIRPDSVLVAPRYAGVCGTDLHIVKGEFPANNVIIGHEVSGVVLAVGEEVTHVKVGDNVAVDPNASGCGLTCSNCAVGRPHLCTENAKKLGALGIAFDGGFAQKMIAPKGQVFLLPPGLSLEQGFLVETLSCVVHGREILGDLDPGATIHILGAGIVGLMWGCLLHHQGYRHITISEPRPARRSTAEALKVFKEVYDPPALTQKIAASSDPHPFDVVIDCCGVARAIQPALDWLRGGGTLLVFACAAPTEELRLPLFQMYKRELRVQGVVINPLAFPKALALLSAMADRYFTLEALGVVSYPMEKHEEVFNGLNTGAITKGVFVIN